MNYDFEVFISYRRHGFWPQWVEKRFIPMFSHWLGEELDSDVRIFWDQNLEKGKDWPPDLGEKLASSCVLVPLLSRQYFNSSWCKMEFSLMCARESQYGSELKSERLIVPAIIHDGTELPPEANIIQSAKLQDYSNAFVVDNSPTLETLSAEIRAWVPNVAKAIKRAPKYDPGWTQLAVNEFMALFKIEEAKQERPPNLGNV